MEIEERKKNEDPMSYLRRLTELYHDQKLEWADFFHMLHNAYFEGEREGRLFVCDNIKDDLVRMCPELNKIEVNEGDVQKLLAGEFFGKACDRYQQVVKEMDGKPFDERKKILKRYVEGL